MSKSWLYIFGLMIVSSFVSVYMGSLVIAIALDLVVLAVAHFLFKRDPFVDYKSSMIFMTILTGINILDVLRLVPHYMIREGFFALIIWGWFGAHNKFFRLFILGSVVYNAIQLYDLYQDFGVVDIIPAAISLVALVLVAYFDSKR